MFGRKKKELQHEVDEFKNIVTNLWGGLHKVDAIVEKIDNELMYGYDKTCFVVRNLEDTISLLQLYRDNRFFHTYNKFMIDQGILVLSQSMSDIESNARRLDDIAFKLHQIHESFSDDEEDADDEFSDNQMINQLKSLHAKIIDSIHTIHMTYQTIRSTLTGVRIIVSKDYMTLITGVDVVRLYQDTEENMKRELRHEIRFDKYQFIKAKGDRKE